jgi:hydroxyquinol 1,2-dioxygenase
MIIENQADVTKAVLSELAGAPDPRFREIMSAFIRHLHDFAREVKLTEQEFQAAAAYVNALGKHTNENHNEAVLMAGTLGFSALVCLLNNGDHGQTETDASQLGPFWRMHSPLTKSGAEVDVWHSSPDGFYENQDPTQADMNLRGKFITDAQGHFGFRSVKPAGYPIPIDGPVGDLLRAQGRHNMRPAHLHFLAYKPGYKTLISQIYPPDDKYIDSDVQFGVTRHLLGNFVRHDTGSAPAPDVRPPWYSLTHNFVMEAGSARLPRAPISGKAAGERPQIPHLEPA